MNGRMKKFRPVIAMTDTGEPFAQFRSVKLAAKITDTRENNIIDVAQGRRKLEGGYKWKFLDQKKAGVKRG